jgi:dipeptidyl aminopeptidase/acylaminoacyl peptidase
MMKLLLTTAQIVLLLLTALSLNASGQAPRGVPSTDIFLLDLTSRQGHMSLGQPRNITKRAGYDNQPMFSADGKSLFYTSIREDNQADIYLYDLAKAAARQITATKESEYSPTLTPDGKALSVIRVEADTAQRLWSFPLSGAPPSLILQNIKPVGYHLWLNQNRLLLFVLGQPATLQMVDAKTEKAETLADNPGRTLLAIPKQQKVSFVHKVSDSEWLIKSFDLKSRQISTLTKTLPGVEYFCWTPQAVLLMAKGAKLYRWDAGKPDSWQEVGDLSAFGLKTMSRLAVSPQGDKLALVAECEKDC